MKMNTGNSKTNRPSPNPRTRNPHPPNTQTRVPSSPSPEQANPISPKDSPKPSSPDEVDLSAEATSSRGPELPDGVTDFEVFLQTAVNDRGDSRTMDQARQDRVSPLLLGLLDWAPQP